MLLHFLFYHSNFLWSIACRVLPDVFKCDLGFLQEFQSPLLCEVHLGTESEHQVLNGRHFFVSFMQILVLFPIFA